MGADFVKAKPRRETVVIEYMKFTPQEIHIGVNDSILWKNKDIVPHTVASESKEFNSKEIAPGSRWTYVFRKAGTYSYKCDYHPSMSGKVIVEDRKY